MLSKLLEKPPLVALTIAAIVPALLILAAHGFETFADMAPCPLCLRQREIHWTGMSAALCGLAALFFINNRTMTRLSLIAVGVIFLWSMIIAGFHAGVEWKFWEAPPSCMASGEIIENPSDILDGIDHLESVSCTDAPWQMFGISMAGYNALVSAGLALMSFAAAWRGKGTG